jgi:hypothetical protein
VGDPNTLRLGGPKWVVDGLGERIFVKIEEAGCLPSFVGL